MPGVPLNGSGAVLARYVYAGSINVPALIVTSSASYRVVVDHLGSVRMVVNTSTGTIVERVDYTSFDDCMDDCSADSGVPQ